MNVSTTSTTEHTYRQGILNSEGKQKAEWVVAAFQDLHARLASVIPAGPDFDLVVSKLEEASAFAHRGVGADEENQQIGADLKEQKRQQKKQVVAAADEHEPKENAKANYHRQGDDG